MTAAKPQPSLSALLGILAKHPDVTPEKMKIAVDAVKNEAMEAARRAFLADFTALQAELPEISKDGELMRDGKPVSRFSRWEDMQRVLKPLLAKHHFVLNFHNEFPSSHEIEVLAVLTHKDGQHMENSFRLSGDVSDQKNANQAMGSSQSYAMRYATIGLLNIVCAGSDADAATDEPAAEESAIAPEGYLDAIKRLHAASLKGQQSLQRSFARVDPNSQEFLLTHGVKLWAEIKTQAQQADAQ